MTPSFCGECGHRLYQHDAKGCEHRERIPRVVRCRDEDCELGTGNAAIHEHYVELSCGCRTPHPLIAAAP